ncbi:MAG: 50S ribosomal protein L22 [Patescibacteria group bacterium]|nr:50S ribosomal protein L22 [Patescibacteria group bacterium]
MKQSSRIISPASSKIATARLRHLRMAPRKVRLIGNIIKRMPVGEAEAQLLVHARRASDPMLKLLRSAIDNAKKSGLDIAKTIVKEVRTDKGPMLKRWMPRAQGRATPIHKHTSHISMILQETEQIVATRFVPGKRVKKKEHEHEHEHDHSSKKQSSKDKEHREDEVKTEVKTKDKGFSQKMFQRKSV